MSTLLTSDHFTLLNGVRMSPIVRQRSRSTSREHETSETIAINYESLTSHTSQYQDLESVHG